MTKRKATASMATSKRCKPSTRVSVEKTFSLLELPPEVLDIVLSHIVVIPWHPRNATFPAKAIDDLFPPSILHVNQHLRQRTLRLITRDCLFIRIESRTRGIQKEIDILTLRVPSVPKIWKNVLPGNLSVVSFELGDPSQSVRITRHFNKDDQSLLLPFNYHSFTEVISYMAFEGIRNVAIRTTYLPAFLQTVYEEQIRPVVDILRFDTRVIVAEAGSESVAYHRHPVLDPLRMKTRFEVNILMQLILKLDAAGHRLEATLMCMYYGQNLEKMAAGDAAIRTPFVWIEEHQGLCDPNWRSHQYSLERMRLVRSIHYIKQRACLGYLEGVKDLGYDFVVHLPAIDSSIDISARSRWLDEPSHHWFGLPDHELAEVFHYRALLLCHHIRYIRLLIRDKFLDRDRIPQRARGNRSPSHIRNELLLQAVHNVWAAWALDMNNPVYCAHLQEMKRLTSKYKVNHLWTSIRTSQNIYDYTDVDGISRLWFGGGAAFDIHHFYGSLKYAPRAQEISRLANVAYDQRRGGALPKPFDKADFLRRSSALLKTVPDTSQSSQGHEVWQGEFAWEDAGLDTTKFLPYNAKYMHHDVAPWKDWTLYPGHFHDSATDSKQSLHVASVELAT